MNNSLLKIPLATNKVIMGKDFESVTLSDSIRQQLGLIITTRFGEHAYDESFGCEIWSLDFEVIVSERLWEEKLRQSLMNSIETHEVRLKLIEIKVTIQEVTGYKGNLKQSPVVRKKVEINIRGNILKTGEPLQYTTNLFLSPLTTI